MAEGSATIECGFCLRKNEALEDPKVLACTHVHCFKCLKGFYEVNHMLQCPLAGCGRVTEVEINSLPSADTPTNPCTQCDRCMKRGDNSMAIVYCTQCNSKYCVNHLKSHDDIHDDHNKVNMAEYKVKVKRLEDRQCVNHKGQQYILGCKVCLTVGCVECLADLGNCVNERLHDLLSLDGLMTTLVGEDIKVKMVDKEERLERLFKLTSKVSSEYDVKTEEMVDTLNKKRNEQLKVISEKYDKLEEELVEKRKKKRLELTEFLEDNVLKRWNEMRNHRLKIESRLEYSHQVDIAKGYQELKDEVKQLIEDVLPRLDLVDVVELSAKAESRDIELEIASSTWFSIDTEQGVHQFSTSMTLQRTLKVSSAPLSVCHYKGDVYVGLQNGTVATIDSNYQVSESFIKCTVPVESITVYKDRVYTLLFHSPSDIVRVYDMSGTQITQWAHSPQNYYTYVLSVVSDQLVIADRPNKRLTVYSLTGTVLRYIPCSLLGSGRVVQCAVDDTSVVISDYSTCKVSRLNIASGEVMWTYSTSKPQGITCYGGGSVILASQQSSTLQILDVNSGEKIFEITDDNLGDDMLGLTTACGGLVVARRSPNSVLFYK